MSEHERRVNDKDIKAYENMDVSAIQSVKTYDKQVQENYVNKIFTNQD